ncbi:glycosyl transferase [Amycolatopsis mediterranei S699]|uniref:Glycosyltransferase n=2 Tax=Amycolatopsis mediterranei TaxID=33910 RepID=A0A0H3DLK5_AMYMU|nr:glycosyltransferase family 2 protein [Amycolatopsis mediterranei]ADJ50599.1 glycosyltransferase [Amycolatopsis mediterranei U32]AEK47605.1 glycosyl transferase [Amycolatopsis mediterranei S699]AFO82305.1 glycosyl transferase [Amycolatopsis mediterranei S699]AGT89434.1 glycosyl transferase [Amycolatopsis mediterranei RB]KDO09299.1 glycosyl transferase [Amycolatopsis mediterranei]
MSANPLLPSLSVVIPVYNEQDWIERSVGALLASASAASWPIEVVVVDDGSTDATPSRLDDLRERHGITVLGQANAGRFEARRAGIAKSSGEWIALLDSRVIVDEHALTFLRDQLVDHPERAVWNGHINVASEHNPYAGFMAGLVKVPWRKYCANPRLMSYGIEEFDVYPKGTTFFCARRGLLEGSVTAFASLFDDLRFASDDTRMLRWIAEHEWIWLAPELSATYHGRDSFKKFTQQAYFRGTTYVDSYIASPGPARNALFGALAAGAVGLVFAAKKPKTTLAAGVLGAVAAGQVVRKCGATGPEARAVSTLLPVFAGGFGAGVLRGLAMAGRARLRRR